MSGSFEPGLIPFYTTQFTTNLELLLQQQGSMLRGRCREGMHTGKMASPINQIGTLALKAPAGRFAPLPNQQAALSRRWVFPQEGELPQLVDSFDELQTIVDPKSGLVETAANAVGRAWDDCLILQATGVSNLGQDANSLTTETFTTASYQIASTFGNGSTACGLTVSKLIECKRIFRHYHNNLEYDPPTIVIGSQQESDLLNQVQVVSTEFNDRPVLVDGQVKRFLGFDVVLSERLPQTTVNSVRGVLAFVKSGLYLGIWKDMTNNIDNRVDLSGRPWQILTQTMYGATRTQLGKVVQILCSDTTGADINP